MLVAGIALGTLDGITLIAAGRITQAGLAYVSHGQRSAYPITRQRSACPVTNLSVHYAARRETGSIMAVKSCLSLIMPDWGCWISGINVRAIPGLACAFIHNELSENPLPG